MKYTFNVLASTPEGGGLIEVPLHISKFTTIEGVDYYIADTSSFMECIEANAHLLKQSYTI